MVLVSFFSLISSLSIHFCIIVFLRGGGLDNFTAQIHEFDTVFIANHTKINVQGCVAK